jgi:hypothetical protein
VQFENGDILINRVNISLARIDPGPSLKKEMPDVAGGNRVIGIMKKWQANLGYKGHINDPLPALR